MQNKTKKETSIFKILKIHTLICQNVHTITNLQNFHTYIQILQKLKYQTLLGYQERINSFFLPPPPTFHVSVQLTNMETLHVKKKRIKKKKKNECDSNSLSLPFARCVLPELSQCSGKLSRGTHNSTQTGSYHKSPLCKKITCQLHAHTHIQSCTGQRVNTPLPKKPKQKTEPCYRYNRISYSTEYKTY